MDFTYDEVGATGGEGPLPPPGFRLLRVRTRLGTGAEVYRAAGRELCEWRMHRRTGVRVEATAPRAEPRGEVVIGLGVGRLRLRAPCRVVWAADEPRRTGWAYGTLPGHPACGEEAFEVTHEADDTVWLTVTAFSRAAGWYMRAAGPLAPLAQRWYARRCGRVLRRLAAPDGGRRRHP
jgi:uncharacterized protein (UPF0548 family)